MAVVNAHISRARAEYESIADKRLVHGVAVGYLGSDSAVSDPFCAEVHTHVPLRRFPRARLRRRVATRCRCWFRGGMKVPTD